MVEIEYRRRKGLRRLRMSFDDRNRLVVSVPWRCPAGEARAFVESNREWVDRQRAKLAPVLGLYEFLSRQPWISVGGKRIAITMREVDAGRALWIYDERRSEGLFHLPRRAGCEDSLRTLFRKLAAEALPRRVHELAGIHGFQPRKITVRDQRSRWGSCSEKGTLSLNWRLLLATPEVQDYVILHELAHLIHLNHSPAFYELLTRLDPDRKKHEAELNREGSRLMRAART